MLQNRAQSLLLGQRCTRTFLLRASSRVILVNILFRFLIFYDKICFSVEIPFQKCAGCHTSCEQQKSYGNHPARGKFVWKLVCPYRVNKHWMHVTHVASGDVSEPISLRQAVVYTVFVYKTNTLTVPGTSAFLLKRFLGKDAKKQKNQKKLCLSSLT